MLIDDISQQLKAVEQDITAIETFWKNSKNETLFSQLQERVHHENFWQDKDRITISQKFEHLKTLRESYQEITTSFYEAQELSTLFADDEASLTTLAQELPLLTKRITKFKINLLLRGEHDSSNAFVSINSGAGGTESQDWAEMLVRMYQRFAEQERFSVELLDHQPGEAAGIKSATLLISGPNAYGLLKSEHGVHRLVRISPFDSSARRHTSFSSVSISPQINDDAAITIDDKDLRIDTYRASGAGGQHVNKTDSAVRITHIPSGIVVQCQNGRSQIQNKKTAMNMLLSRLVQKKEEEKKAAQNAVEKQKIEWGSQIRSYVLHPYKMVKDLRTQHESSQPDNVLDGNLMPFIESWLIQQ